MTDTPKQYWETELRFPFCMKDVVKEVPGVRWNNTTKQWLAPTEAVPAVRALLKTKGYSLFIPGVPSVCGAAQPINYLEGAYEHQQKSVTEAVRHLLAGGRWIVADDPGLGKAFVSIRTIANVCPNDRVLVVCPASVMRTWERNIQEWWPGQKPTVGFYRYGERKQTTAKQREEREFALEQAQVIICSRGLLDTLPAGLRFSLLVIDEAHQYKTPKAQCTRAASTLIDGHRVLALTGTPAPNDVSDLSGLVHLIYPNRLGKWTPTCAYSYQFNHYFLEGENQGSEDEPRWVWGQLKPERADELSARLPYLMSHHTWDEVPGNYRLEPNLIYVDLKAEEWAGYDTAMNAASGETRFESMTEALQKPKIAAAKEWVKEHEGQKVVIYTHLKSTADALGEALGVTAITGDMQALERSSYIRASGSRVVATMHSIGIGINDLADFDCALFAELYWKSDVIEQAASRLRRLCQPKSASIDFLVGSATVEESMAKSLTAKLDNLTKANASTSFGGLVQKALDNKNDTSILDALFSSERNQIAVGGGEDE